MSSDNALVRRPAAASQSLFGPYHPSTPSKHDEQQQQAPSANPKHNQQQLATLLSSQSVKSQKLPDHIFYLIAKLFITHPKDVFHLAVTNKSMWGWLKIEIYRAEVLFTKQQERGLLFPRLEVLDFPVLREPGAAERMYLYNTRPNLTKGKPALHQAARKRNVKLVQRLIKESAKYWPGYLDVKCQNITALSRAVWRHHDEIVELLVEAGCYVDTWHPELAELRKVVSDGCEFVPGVELRVFHYRIKSLYYSPLTMAIAMGRREQALLLAQHINDAGLIPKVPQGYLYPGPLHLAAFAGMKAVVETLLARGYSPFQKSELFEGATPLRMAASGVDNNQAVMNLLFNDDTTYYDMLTAINYGIVHRSPNNVLSLLRHAQPKHLQRFGRPLQGLGNEAGMCLHSDDLLPVLQWILDNDPALETRMRVGMRCQKLIDNKTGVPSATLAYLRKKGVVKDRASSGLSKDDQDKTSKDGQNDTSSGLSKDDQGKTSKDGPNETS